MYAKTFQGYNGDHNQCCRPQCLSYHMLKWASDPGCINKKMQAKHSFAESTHAKPLCLKTSSMADPIFAGDSTTVTPASLRVLILSCAVPFPPDTIAAYETAIATKHC